MAAPLGVALVLGLVPQDAARVQPQAPPREPAARSAASGGLPAAAVPGTARNVEVVGHDPLRSRGMNAAPAIFGDFLYVGSRTDGSPGHRSPGVLIVDVRAPRAPRLVGQIGRPRQGNVGETSRELRVWPQQRLLIVMNFSCSSTLHDCARPAARSAIRFYDLTAPTRPKLVRTYVPSGRPHEMYLWVDPRRAGRALLYISTPTNALRGPNLVVADISRVRQAPVRELVRFNPNATFPAALRRSDVSLHSIGLDYAGTRLHLAYLGGGYLVADSTDLALDRPRPRIRLLTLPRQRVAYDRRPGAHSAVPVPGRPYALLTEEVYGDLIDGSANHGCPWGWLRVADTSDVRRPRAVGEFRLAENSRAFCRTPFGRDPRTTRRTSYSTHNPTVLPQLALVSWHSGGLQVVSLRRPTAPAQVGYFLPRPLRRVATEDPVLSGGRNKVVLWSYPIVKDGLIYVVDVRNGLYVLRYTGPDAASVASVGFLEGNSNLGDAGRLAAPPRPSTGGRAEVRRCGRY